MDDAAFHNVSVNSNLTTLVPAGVGTALKRDVSLILAKTCLSTIPLASLVFDVGDKMINFANKQQVTKFLQSMASEIDQLSSSVRSVL
jgi:hypothetical protein